MKHWLLALVAVSLLGGCTSAVVKDKVTTEVAIHEGYARLIREGKVKEKDLKRMVLASGKAWRSLDYHLNGVEED